MPACTFSLKECSGYAAPSKREYFPWVVVMVARRNTRPRFLGTAAICMRVVIPFVLFPCTQSSHFRVAQPWARLGVVRRENCTGTDEAIREFVIQWLYSNSAALLWKGLSYAVKVTGTGCQHYRTRPSGTVNCMEIGCPMLLCTKTY